MKKTKTKLNMCLKKMLLNVLSRYLKKEKNTLLLMAKDNCKDSNKKAPRYFKSFN